MAACRRAGALVGWIERGPRPGVLPATPLNPRIVRQTVMSELHYWNRANFEGLASLASAFRADQRLKHLATYCDLREKGLRREALAELVAFLEEAEGWDASAQRNVVLRILEGHWRTPQAHQFLAEPLRRRFVEPVLNEWRATEQDNPVPLRQLALLRGDRDLLRHALRINPKDDHVRAAIANSLFRCVDYSTHHLSEGRFIGNIEDAEAALSDATAVLKEATDPGTLGSLVEELRGLTALLADWREYQDAPKGSFPEWCRARNRNHRWWSIVYYDGGSA